MRASDSSQVALPADIARCQSVFREYYDTITSHRRLTWIHSLGQATVGYMCVRVFDERLCVCVCMPGYVCMHVCVYDHFH